MTALNLFLTAPEVVIKAVVSKFRTLPGKKITLLIDIPGQIEVFTWSSSSLILTAALNSILPVKIAYLMDAGRCQNPNSLLSNILFARNFDVK